MPVLLPHQAHAAAEKLADRLSADNRGRLKVLIDTLGGDGRGTVGEVQKALWPGASTPMANKALDRLIKAINDAATKASASLAVAIDGDKKLGPARKLWFEEIGRAHV